MSSAALKRAGLVSCGGACIVAPLVVFLALPPFYSGIWVQVETVAVAIHLCAAAAGIGLLLLALADEHEIGRIAAHPLVILPLLAFLWSVATLPVIDLPSVSWFGAPEHRMGAVIILDFAALTAAAIVVRGYRRLWLAVVGMAVISALGTLLAPMAAVVTALTGLDLPEGKELSPYFFSDYRAFYALYVVVLIISLETRWRRLAWAAALGLGAVLLYASHNKAAVGYAAVLLPAYALLCLWVRDDDKLRRIGAWGAALLPIALTVLLYAVGMVVLARARAGDAPAQFLLDSIPTVWSRALMTHLAVVAFAADNGALLTGFGWGHFGEVLLRHLNEIPVRLYISHGAQSIPFWDAVHRFDFHSHNLFVESLLAGGIVGLGLALAWTAAIAYFARESLVGVAGAFALIFAALGTFWFQMPVSVPVLTLAVAALAGNHEVPVSAPLRRAAVILLCGIGPLIQIASAAAGITLAQRGAAEADAIREVRAVANQEKEKCRLFVIDSGIGDAYLAWLFQGYVDTLIRRFEAREPIGADHVARLRRLLCTTDRRLAETDSLTLLVTGLSSRAGLVFQLRDPAVASVLSPYRDNWGERMERLLELAPRRTDLATAYLNWLLAQGREREVLGFAERLLARDPGDPVGLWFSGSVLLGDSRHAAEGMARLRRSLDQGIADILPISAELLQSIRAPSSPSDRK